MHFPGGALGAGFRRRPRSRPAVVLVALVGLLAPAPAQAAAPPGEQIADKRAEAQRLEAELAAQGRRISMLAEELNVARLGAERLEGELRAARAQLARTNDQVIEARERLKSRAVVAYMQGGRVPGIEMVAAGPAHELGKRHAYVRALAGRDRAAVDALEEAEERQAAHQATLSDAKEAAREALAAVEARRQEAAGAAAARRATLERVRGELATLVEAEARRRAEEESRRAREALAARQAAARQASEETSRRAREQAAAREAEEAARRAAAPTAGAGPAPVTRPPVTSGGGGSPAAGAEAAVAEAKRQLGKPYEWAADGPDSFDCSGLTLWAWRAGGRSLPHSSRAQFDATRRVDLDDIQIGDLVFYGTPIHHVGIYVGDGRMVEASETGTPVRYASIYRSDMVGVGRVG